MELFTLGVDNYSEQDVRESARAWTGWSVNRRNDHGHLRCVACTTRGSKRFSAIPVTLPATNRQHHLRPAAVREIFCGQPAQLRSSTTIPNRNSSTASPASCAPRFRARRRSWRRSCAATLLQPDRAYRALVKSPVEFVVGTYSALGLAEIDDFALAALAQMGQRLFFPPNVAGWPGGKNWLTSGTMIARQNFLDATAQLADAGGVVLVARSLPVQSRTAARAAGRRHFARRRCAGGARRARRLLERRRQRPRWRRSRRKTTISA